MHAATNDAHGDNSSCVAKMSRKIPFGKSLKNDNGKLSVIFIITTYDADDAVDVAAIVASHIACTPATHPIQHPCNTIKV